MRWTRKGIRLRLGLCVGIRARVRVEVSDGVRRLCYLVARKVMVGVRGGEGDGGIVGIVSLRKIMLFSLLL